jgi:hypothetical protein
MADAEGPSLVAIEQSQQLATSWLMRFLREAGFEFSGQSLTMTPTFTIGPHTGFHITVTGTEAPPWISATSSDPAHQTLVDELVTQSAARVEVGDFGGHVWYRCTVGSGNALEKTMAAPQFMVRIQEMLNNQGRIIGWIRLGNGVLLNFREELPEGQDLSNMLFAPPAVIDMYVAIPGPADGPFTLPLAHGVYEVACAFCSMMLGRPINTPVMLDVADAALVDELENRHADQSIPYFAVNGEPLNFDELIARGGQPSLVRVQGALIAYDAALRQEREQVAVILYVVAAECLTNPSQPWKTSRLTSRFIKFFDELMPNELDGIVQHANFEEAFGITRGNSSAPVLRRKLLDRIYELRSDPVHEGLSLAFGVLGSGVAEDLAGRSRRCSRNKPS